MGARTNGTLHMVVLGARGQVGRRIVDEALSRGHRVTAVVRRSEQLAALPMSVDGEVADVSEPEEVARVAAGASVVVNATRPIPGADVETVATTRAIMEGTARVGARLLVSGGAAILTVPDADDRLLLDDSRYLPPDLREIGEASRLQFEVLEAEGRGVWTYLCPPADLRPGVRTGRYRLGTRTLLTNAEGYSGISMEDLAVALVDEAERAQTTPKRVLTVASVLNSLPGLPAKPLSEVLPARVCYDE